MKCNFLFDFYKNLNSIFWNKNRWNDGDSSRMLVSIDTSTEKPLPLGKGEFTNKEII